MTDPITLDDLEAAYYRLVAANEIDTEELSEPLIDEALELADEILGALTPAVRVCNAVTRLLGDLAELDDCTCGVCVQCELVDAWEAWRATRPSSAPESP